mmetsp:Transcript_14229/g.28393  ORF Transcript_14229/g.28393 Transcript_14229/m.28393 type:complete len:551 (+) Transcript_14229:181-1833(+)
MKGKQGPGAGLNAFSCRGQHPHFAIAGAAVVGRRRSQRRALCQHPGFQGGRRQAPQHDLDGVVHEQRHAEQRQRLGVLEHDLQHGDAQGQRLVHGAEEHGHHVRAGETLFAVGVLFALVTALVAVTAQATAAAIAAATPAFAPASAAAAANLMRVGGQLEDGVHVDELEGHDECTRSQQHRSRDLVKHACFAANSFRRPLATTTTPPASATVCTRSSICRHAFSMQTLSRFCCCRSCCGSCSCSCCCATASPPCGGKEQTRGVRDGLFFAPQRVRSCFEAATQTDLTQCSASQSDRLQVSSASPLRKGGLQRRRHPWKWRNLPRMRSDIASREFSREHRGRHNEQVPARPQPVCCCCYCCCGGGGGGACAAPARCHSERRRRRKGGGSGSRRSGTVRTYLASSVVVVVPTVEVVVVVVFAVVAGPLAEGVAESGVDDEQQRQRREDAELGLPLIGGLPHKRGLGVRPQQLPRHQGRHHSHRQLFHDVQKQRRVTALCLPAAAVMRGAAAVWRRRRNFAAVVKQPELPFCFFSCRVWVHEPEQQQGGQHHP